MAVTMKDVAKKTGLGIATISKYLNGGKVRPKNKQLLDEAIRELKFVPNEFARSLKTRQSRAIGVVIPELSNAFITSIISTLEDELRHHGYTVIVCDCRTDITREQEAISFLLSKRVDALINMPTDPEGAHLKQALDAGVPIVLVDRMLPQLADKVSAVIVDNEAAAQKATSALLEAGHRDIGIVLGSEGLYTTRKRQEGYLCALQSHGVPVREEYIVFCDYTMESGYQATQRLLQLKNPPSALFITNYEMTIGAMIALNALGVRVPEDMSVIGFDKVDMFDAIFPDLTLIKQPQAAIGKSVAARVLALLGESDTPHQITILSTQYKQGGSVAKKE